MTEINPIDTADRWNELYTAPRFSPRYPSELVIRWTFRHFPREKAGEFNLLDAGAGAGRHTLLWAREGYVATATDVSPNAISQALDWARQKNLSINAEVAEVDRLPFRDEQFDGVLSFGVLYYLPYPRMKGAISEMWRVLKPGGRAFVLIKSDADSRCCKDNQIDHWSYRIETPPSGAYWAAEVGMTLTLLDRNALQECFTAFSEIVIDRSTVTSCNGRFVDDEWLIHLRK